MCCVGCFIVVPPRNLVIDIQKEVAVEGEEIELNCTAMASRPATTIRWFKGNKELTGRCILSAACLFQIAEMIYVTLGICSLLPAGGEGGGRASCLKRQLRNKGICGQTDYSRNAEGLNSIWSSAYPPGSSTGFWSLSVAAGDLEEPQSCAWNLFLRWFMQRSALF